MQVYHRCFDTGVSHEALDGADVGFGFEYVCGERMAQRVACGAFRNCGLADSILQLSLHGGFVQVVAGDSSRARMRTKSRGGEEVLPAPLAGCIGPFPHQRFRHVNVPRADSEVLKVFFAETGEVFLKPLLQGHGQGDDAVFSILSIMDGDGSLAEIQILDAQAHGFHEPEAAAIHDLGNQFPWILFSLGTLPPLVGSGTGLKDQGSP